MGQKIDNFFLDSLEMIFASIYLPPEQKMPLLAKAISKIDAVKFFLQIVWENKLIAAEQYSELIMKLQEIGRMLGGWRKGLLNKTPASPRPTGEKQ
ncbi:MAG: four helix bundle protein [bacterium]|nr:four helix bundle protein [bacterium]